MTYRAVVRHVRYWRGKIHRWSTVYQYVGNPTATLDDTDCQEILQLDDAMCYGQSAVDGGTYQCEIYNNASGGVPIANFTRFDWQTPGTWIKYGSGAWGPASADIASPAETALLVEWPCGLSKSGKPVSLRKWYHAVPTSGEPGAQADVSAGDLVSLQAKASQLIGPLGAKGLVLGSATGRLAGDPVVKAFYGNHQMPRGRRKKPAFKASLVSLSPSTIGKLLEAGF